MTHNSVNFQFVRAGRRRRSPYRSDMKSGRSLRACNLCRQRRVKCDKTLPTCARCVNFGQPCPGYPLFKKFIDQGSKARQRVIQHRIQTPAPRGVDRDVETSLIDVSESPLTIPSHGLTTTSDSADDTLQDIGSELEAYIDGDLRYFDLDIESYYADGNNACGFFADLADIEVRNDLVDQPDTATLASETRINQHAAGVQNDPQIGGARDSEITEYDSETSILMRLYVEMLAPWMDLFDTEAYFTRVVPHNSAFDALLRLALTAVAAKQTARYLISRHPSQYSKLLDLVLAEHANDSPDQWFYRAASYYDQGISYLRNRLQNLIGKYRISDFNNAASNVFSQPIHSTPLGASSNSSFLQPKAITYEQNVLSAVSLFSFYETLDECVSSPSQHLTGFLALAECLDAGTPSLRAESRLLFASKSAGRAAFWYFVRKDTLTSYSRGSKPAFDAGYRQLWIAAGLPDEVFSIQHDSDSWDGFQTLLGPGITEDVEIMTYIIIWLSWRVVSMIRSYGQYPLLSHGVNVSSPSLATSAQIRLEEAGIVGAAEWARVCEQLDWWFEFRPQIFHAYAFRTTNPPADDRGKITKTAFFTCSTGVAAMQLYHFVRILLLLNQPSNISNESNQVSRLRALKKSNLEIEFHSLEICAGALEMPSFAVQRQMSNPLQLAGAYLDSSRDQAVISRTLANVLVETCSPTEDMT